MNSSTHKQAFQVFELSVTCCVYIPPTLQSSPAFVLHSCVCSGLYVWKLENLCRGFVWGGEGISSLFSSQDWVIPCGRRGKFPNKDSLWENEILGERWGFLAPKASFTDWGRGPCFQSLQGIKQSNIASASWELAALQACIDSWLGTEPRCSHNRPVCNGCG